MTAKYRDWIIVFDMDGEEKSVRFKSAKRHPFSPGEDVDDAELMEEIEETFGEDMYGMMQDHYPADLA